MVGYTVPWWKMWINGIFLTFISEHLRYNWFMFFPLSDIEWKAEYSNKSSLRGETLSLHHQHLIKKRLVPIPEKPQDKKGTSSML